MKRKISSLKKINRILRSVSSDSGHQQGVLNKVDQQWSTNKSVETYVSYIVDLFQLLGLTPDQGDKSLLTLWRPPATEILMQDAAEATPAPLHWYRGTYVRPGCVKFISIL